MIHQAESSRAQLRAFNTCQYHPLNTLIGVISNKHQCEFRTCRSGNIPRPLTQVLFVTIILFRFGLGFTNHRSIQARRFITRGSREVQNTK